MAFVGGRGVHQDDVTCMHVPRTKRDHPHDFAGGVSENPRITVEPSYHDIIIIISDDKGELKTYFVVGRGMIGFV